MLFQLPVYGAGGLKHASMSVVNLWLVEWTEACSICVCNSSIAGRLQAAPLSIVVLFSWWIAEASMSVFLVLMVECSSIWSEAASMHFVPLYRWTAAPSEYGVHLQLVDCQHLILLFIFSWWTAAASEYVVHLQRVE
jgi:hypothetical protein